ncbi:MAG: ribosome-associated translation inhibitor RaiA [Lautropia sp.]|nr:ribosome-associated translation inhibitor RaiA [Lautropia sp.]
MNLSISGHHLEVTPALRDYVTSKLDRIRHHFDQVIDVSVILSVDKSVQRAEMKLLVAGKELFAEATHTDLYAAIDTLIDRLDRQVIKYKQKRQSHDAGRPLKRPVEPV